MSTEDYPPQSAEQHAAAARAANDLWGDGSRDMSDADKHHAHLSALTEATLALYTQLATLTEALTHPPRTVEVPTLMPDVPTHIAPRHNHVTRDIKPKGRCPACDAYWDAHTTPERSESYWVVARDVAGGIRLNDGMGELIAAKDNTLEEVRGWLDRAVAPEWIRKYTAVVDFMEMENGSRRLCVCDHARINHLNDGKGVCARPRCACASFDPTKETPSA